MSNKFETPKTEKVTFTPLLSFLTASTLLFFNVKQAVLFFSTQKFLHLQRIKVKPKEYIQTENLKWPVLTHKRLGKERI